MAPTSACAGISAMVVAFIILAVLQDKGVIDVSTESIALIIGIVTLTMASLGLAILLVARCQDEDRHLVELDGDFTPATGPFVGVHELPVASGDGNLARLGERGELEEDRGRARSAWSWQTRCMLLLLVLLIVVGAVTIILSQNAGWAAGGRALPSDRRPIPRPDTPEPTDPMGGDNATASPSSPNPPVPSPAPSPSPSPDPVALASLQPRTACVSDRSVNLAFTILATGYACAYLAPFGVRCEVEYQAISSVCPGSRDKADWIFSMYYRMTGECDTIPASTRLTDARTMPFLHPSVIDRCLERRTTADTCIGDRSSLLSSTLVAAGAACSRMLEFGVDCARDYPLFDCPTKRDYADWVFSAHYMLTGTCATMTGVSLLVARDAIGAVHSAVKPACLERWPA